MHRGRLFVKAICLFLFIAVLGSKGISQEKKLQALFAYGTFYSPEKGPYVETYLSVNGNSVHYTKNQSGNFQAQIEITYTFKKNDSIVQFDKYRLLSPETADSSAPKVNFLDQQRIAIPNGDYILDIKIKDTHSELPAFMGQQPVKVEYSPDKMGVSTIQLIDRYQKSTSNNIFSKSGTDIIPNVTDFYPDVVNSLKFYAEVYNSDRLETDKYLIKYYIANHQSKLPIPEYTGFIRQPKAPVSVVLREFNIEKLPTGNYYVVLEARNKDNVLMAYQSSFFQRTNMAADTMPLDLASVQMAQTFVENIRGRDTLKDYIRSTRPIADQMERDWIDLNAQKGSDVELENLQKFFYAFWYKRNALNPELEWRNYAIEVQKVNKEFGTSIKKGYATDRGRVYLQYGPPDTRVEIPSEPNSYPYEIWQYLKIGRQNNGRFVFYTTDLITNDYVLLHSTVFGEPNYERWDMELQRRSTPQFDLDQTNPGGSVGSRAREYFNDPR